MTRAAASVAATALILLFSFGAGRPVLAANLDPVLAVILLAAAKKAEISSLYGPRCHPQTGEPQFHRGIDISAPLGTPIFSPADAVVDRKYTADREGRSIVLRYGSTEFLFFHLNQTTAQVGDQVAAGDQIGTVGDSGECTGPHLHFAVKKHGQFIDPKQYFHTDAAKTLLAAKKEQ